MIPIITTRVVIILNGISRKKKKFYRQILPGLQEKFDVVVWETKHRDHASELAREAVELNPLGVLAAGGDGTLNQVLNGVLQASSENKPQTIGIIPLGTGNDFARLNEILPTPESIVSKIQGGGKLTDIGRVDCQRENGEQTTRYFINVTSLGMGPEVVRRLFKSKRFFGPSFTYMKVSIETFLAHKPEFVQIEADDWTWRGKLRVLAIANGQSFGSGLYVAPGAKPDDGVLSTFIAGEVPLLRFLTLLQRIKSTKKIQDKFIHYNSCRRLSLTAPEICWIETEGELAGVLPAIVEIIPGGIKFFR